MRPEIPEELERRIEATYEEGGYATPSGLVRDAVRQRVAVIESTGENPPLVALSEGKSDGGTSAANESGYERSSGKRLQREEPDPAFEDRNWKDQDGVVYGNNPFNDAPVIVDRFHEKVGGNQLVAGDIGSGKTVSTNLHLKRTLEMYEDVRVVFIDPLGTGESLADAVSSQQVDLESGGFNPLSVPSQGGWGTSTIDRKADLITLLVEMSATSEPSITNSEIVRSVCTRAVRKAVENRSDEQTPITLADVREQLANISEHPGNEAFPESERVEKEIGHTARDLFMHTRGFSDDQKLGAFGRASTVDISDERMTWIPLADIANGRSEQAAIYAAVHGAFEQARAIPDRVIIAIDEAHYLLGRDAAEPMARLLRHGRHDDVGFHLVTQTLEMMGEADALVDIISNCSVTHLHRRQNLSDEVATKLGLSQPEADYVRQAAPGTVNDYAESLIGVSGSWIPTNIVVDEDERKAILDD